MNLAYNTLVLKILSEIDLLLNHFVYNGYAALSHYLRIPFGLIAAMYIVILGYAVMMGWVKVNMGNFVKAALKIGFIYMAVTQWAWVSKYFVQFINSAIGDLGDALIRAAPLHIPGIDGLNGAMQLTLSEFSKLGAVVFDAGGLTNMGPIIDGLMIWGFGYLMVGLGLFEIILAKVMLAVLFVFTPLLVMFCYFKPFQAIFDRWLGAIVGFALLQLFVTATLSLALSLSYWWLAAEIGKSALDIGNFGTLPIVIIGIVCIGLVLKAASLAQNLGGIVSTSAGAAMIGGVIGGAMGASVSGLKNLKLGAKALGKVGGLAAKFGGGILKPPHSSAKSASSQVQTSLRRGEE